MKELRTSPPIVFHPYVPDRPLGPGTARTPQEIGQEIVDRLKAELSGPPKREKGQVAKKNNDRYDWNLVRWTYAKELPGGLRLFRNGDSLRLARYLLRSEEVREKSIGRHLLDKDEADRLRAHFGDLHPDTLESLVLGKIVDIVFPNNTHRGYWVVEQDGEIDIFPGGSQYRPVTLEK
jgi:hypothetical protein